jgi:hypothetical protein
MVQNRSMLMIKPNSWNGKATVNGVDKNGMLGCGYLKEGYDNGNDANDVEFLNQQKLEGFGAALIPPEIRSLLSVETMRKRQ